MSTDAVPCRSLGEYVAELLARLEAGEPAALARMREVVGARRARIALDAEVVEVAFTSAGWTVEPPRPGGRVDGDGGSDRAATLALLDGWLEVTDALLDGAIEARGSLEDVSRMFQAIEILLDASTRVPALQELAGDYRRDPCRAAPTHRRERPRRTPYPPDPIGEDESAVLRRLGLLP